MYYKKYTMNRVIITNKYNISRIETKKELYKNKYIDIPSTL